MVYVRKIWPLIFVASALIIFILNNYLLWNSKIDERYVVDGQDSQMFDSKVRSMDMFIQLAERNDSFSRSGGKDTREQCRDIDKINYKVQQVVDTNSTWQEILEELAMVKNGGEWSPADCRGPTLAIIVPYKDREDNLKTFLQHMHPFLQRQQAHYRIYVVEFVGPMWFNKGVLMNAGYLHAMASGKFECYITHDVDQLPEDDRNTYKCGDQPLHLGVSIQKNNYKLLYGDLIGGALALTRKHIMAVNGYSNMYGGWGGEDDDMAKRLKAEGFNITRPHATLARYSSITRGHQVKMPNKGRHELLACSTERYKEEGLSSLDYRLLRYQETPLFTHIVIQPDVSMTENYKTWRLNKPCTLRAVTHPMVHLRG